MLCDRKVNVKIKGNNYVGLHNSGKNSNVVRRGNMDAAESTRREIGFRRNVKAITNVCRYTLANNNNKRENQIDKHVRGNLEENPGKEVEMVGIGT